MLVFRLAARQWARGLQMSHPVDSRPPQAECVLPCSERNQRLSQELRGHGLHTALSSKVQAPFQQRDGEPVRHQTLYPN